MPKIQFTINKEKDAKNWYRAANKSSYGLETGKFMPSDIREKIQGETEETAMSILLPHIEEKYYQTHDMQKVLHELHSWWEIHGTEIFGKMEEIVGKPIPTQIIRSFITTTGSCPYHAPKWLHYYCPFKNGKIKSPEESVGTVTHELLHMMLHYYYEEYILGQGLNDYLFHELKEAQTVILNEAYKNILTTPDTGYPRHSELRKKFAAFRHTNKNFDEFVAYCIDIVKETGSVSDFLLTEKEYEKKNKAVPYTYEIQQNNQNLYYIGCDHSFDIDNPQNTYIEKSWSTFLASKNTKKIAIIEANIKEISLDKYENIKHAGESGLVGYLAQKQNIENLCPEPAYAEKIKRLEKNFSKEQIFYSECGIRLGIVHRKNDIGNWESHIQKAIERLKQVDGWANIDMNITMFLTLHKQCIGTTFDVHDKQYWCNINNPTDKYQNFTNNISRKDSEERELHITNTIINKRKEGYDIFVVYGEYHAIVQQLALQHFCK